MPTELLLSYVECDSLDTRWVPGRYADHTDYRLLAGGADWDGRRRAQDQALMPRSTS